MLSITGKTIKIYKYLLFIYKWNYQKNQKKENNVRLTNLTLLALKATMIALISVIILGR